ncbi:uncharacterized protein LOC103514437, partial [Diaphorina citri]|uniref:Uncharacterized protein LOC103514437 n=1 Tax=Diaphorina citri TaxID=121845 RepID=A0A3Q0J912_DIACI
MHKENTELPGVWTKKKTKKFATPIPSYPAPPSFPIHVDEGCEEEQHKPSVQLSSRVLQTKKMDVVDASQHVSSLFDTTASSKERHMFCKNKVFLGKTDLQVEEFRAAKHRKDKYGTCLLPRPHGDTIPVCESEPEDSSRVNMFSKSQIYIGNNKEVQLEEVRASQHRKKPSPDDDIPVFIMEPEDKKKRPMYRKHQIYIGGNKEVQLEELRAVQYRTNKSRSSQTTQPSNKAALWTEEIPVCIPCANDKAKPMYRKSEATTPPREFELQIRTYDGPDPLQLRFDYVQWLEQSYPCLGPETNIIPFLEETLVAFKNIEQYKQDPRYVSLVIKYIGTQPNPLEIYNLVYSENIGTKLAMFYKAWAEVLDAHNDIKQANHVFQLGLNAHAEPIEDLEAAQ